MDTDEEIRSRNSMADQIAMQKGEGHNVVSDAAIRARDQAADHAALPVDERVEIGRLTRERDEERQRAASRAPRRLRLNVTEAQGYGYVGCSLFQSDNGVNWGAIATTVVIPEQWFADVFGKADVGRRIEFEIANPHDVKED